MQGLAEKEDFYFTFGNVGFLSLYNLIIRLSI